MSDRSATPPDGENRPTITIYSDYVCPFCYLGRASLDRYQAERDEPLRIDWHPFDLRAGQRGPDGEIDPSVDSGKDEAYYEQARENVRRLQERYDVEMDAEIAEDVDTRKTQQASLGIRERVSYDEWLAVDEAIFAALWQEGRDVGDPAVLADVVDEAGVDPELVEESLADDDLRERLDEAFAAARQAGITGVPSFVYGEYVARGAVPPEQLRRLVEGV